MLVDTIFQHLDFSQIMASVGLAIFSIMFRALLTRIIALTFSYFLPAFLSFLANLMVLIGLFIIFLLSILTLAFFSRLPLPPVP